MKRFLFVFGYESPEDSRANTAGDDAESSNAVWVSAASEEEAIKEGRLFAEQFVAARFKKASVASVPSWRAGNFAHWISKDPMSEYSGLALESFEHIQEPIQSITAQRASRVADC
jgi:hypothetical protein